MKKALKIILIIFIVLALLIAILLYEINKPRTISQISSSDNQFTVSFIEIEGPIFFGSSQVKVELKSNDDETTEKHEITTTIANDGKMLDEDNWKVKFNSGYVEVALKGEEQNDEILKMYYVDSNSFLR